MRKLLPIVLVLFACNVFGESIADLRRKAEAGDAKAQVLLGLTYHHPLNAGVPQDHEEAVYLVFFKKRVNSWRL